VEFTVPSPGHYALRVEGRIPPSIRPPGEPTLPSLQTTWELRPRLFVRVLEDSMRATGRALLTDYVSNSGSPGMPVDARAVLSVGAVQLSGRPEPYSALGPAFEQALRPRPDTFSFDELALGVEPGKA